MENSREKRKINDVKSQRHNPVKEKKEIYLPTIHLMFALHSKYIKSLLFNLLKPYKLLQ